MKKSFTLIEIIFVIVVLSIIGLISAQIIAKIYEQYIMTKTINELETKTELTLNQIANRLQYRIKDATIARKETNSTDIKSLIDADDSYKILEWIGYDNDSFRGEYNSTKRFFTPGWSGFIDLYSTDTNKTQIKTLGSNLEIANKIIENLSNSRASLKTKDNVAIIFKGMPIGFDIEEYGWNDWNGANKHSYIHRVKCPNSGCNEILEFVENRPTREIVEQYRLVWSAYAIVPENSNLYFYYNYRPWMGEKYSDGEKALLAKNVTVFKFRQFGKVVRLKLCIQKIITNDFNLSFCKEKVIY